MPSVFSSKTWKMLRSGNTGVSSELGHFWPYQQTTCSLATLSPEENTSLAFCQSNPMDFYATSSLNYDILDWDQGSFSNYLYPSINLRTCPWISMIEVDFNPSPLALLIEIVINLSPLAPNHLVDPLPFNMVEEMICDTHVLPSMVGKLRNNRDALPFMVEETGQVAYSNMRVDKMYMHTSGVSPLLYWNAQSSWSETLNLKNGGFSICLELSLELCKSDYTFSEYVDLKLHKIWLHLRSSPLLELYRFTLSKMPGTWFEIEKKYIEIS
ncbi:uncharacterized protein LACBIDRAFT_296778 [Laccaria bicolor S238N-H82]|uniref:Predicted protein n=1 Tax=Laccaria bicolor (strain S238N-H82 / ATCC MYA-4686) TaxID=486041 RepID=B0E331_LACBS|nr:uncharacterized protein LACBIDRAFT_296777 [Laccaria bicolor S238N-H82]XP_001890601.1 uncharacterized protein LACBIDRAFT_296778 [Laccaria bicolor S238N-H82]EDQ98751.1 predicted protein [Laccaria bicolor S238N-H82]EDQ98752.1 predicted protein [Laccaria bicolor S238N-H82]|eukprot:XP_001890600.1 predicted protein [Laccaria bicolor S238N-H82]